MKVKLIVLVCLSVLIIASCGQNEPAVLVQKIPEETLPEKVKVDENGANQMTAQTKITDDVITAGYTGMDPNGNHHYLKTVPFNITEISQWLPAGCVLP